MLKYFSINRTGLIIIMLIFCKIGNIKAQFDPQFSQYLHNPAVYNPGYAGMSGQISALAIERHQWTGIKDYPKTTVIEADMALNFFGNSGGAGLMFINDRLGAYSNLFIQGIVSQIFDVGNGKLGVGINLGVINMVLDGTKLKTGLEIGDYHVSADPEVPNVEVSGIGYDFGTGIYYKEKKIFAGLSFLHLFRPQPNFKDDEFNIYIPRTILITAGYNHALWEKPIVLRPSFMIKKTEAVWQYELNFLVSYKERFYGGLSYRHQDAIVVMIGFDMANGIRIGYSYDIALSAVARRSDGSHEINIAYLFDLEIGKRNKRYKNVRFL